MIDNLINLANILDKSGFRTKADAIDSIISNLHKSAIGGGAYSLGGASNKQEAEAWNKENLHGKKVETIEDVQDILDVFSFTPVVGNAADLSNGVISLLKNPPGYLEAALYGIALVPVFGIGAVAIAKLIRGGRKAEASNLVRKSISSVPSITPEMALAYATSGVDEVIRATEVLRKNTGKELMKNLPEKGELRSLIIDQVNMLIRGIEFTSNTPIGKALSRNSDATKAYSHAENVSQEAIGGWVKNLDKIKSMWKGLKVAQIDEYKKAARIAAEAAIERLARMMSEVTEKRIKEMDVNISKENMDKISREMYSHIKEKMSIRIIDDPSVLPSYLLDDPLKTIGEWNGDLISPNIIVNLPGAVYKMTKPGFKFVDELIGVFEHEGYHYLDNLLGDLYYKVTQKAIPTVVEVAGKTLPGGGYASLTGELGDALKKAKWRAGNENYWIDPIEVATRFYSLKNWIKNIGFISNITSMYPRSMTGYLTKLGEKEYLPLALIYDVQAKIIPAKVVETNIRGLSLNIVPDLTNMGWEAAKKEWDSWIKNVYNKS